MINGVMRFYIEFKEELKEINIVNNEEISLISLLHRDFPSSNQFPNSAVDFYIFNMNQNIFSRISGINDIEHNDAIIQARIDEEKLPIFFVFGGDKSDIKKGPFDPKCTIKIKGIPWECHVEGIERFFKGLDILKNGVHINYTEPQNKRHSGDAFVEFGSCQSVKNALLKNGQCIQDRNVIIEEANETEIFHFKRHRFEMKYYRPSSIPMDSTSQVVKLQGLPWDTCYEDVQHLLFDVPLTAIHFPKDKQGRPKGTAFVEVADRELVIRVFGHQRQYIGKRFVEMKKSGINELAKEMKVQLATDENLQRTFCVLLQNLSPQLSNYEIERFFNEKSISPYRIHKKLDGTEAFCEFLRKSDHKNALKTNGMILERNEISVESVSFEEVIESVGLTNDL